MLREVVMFVLIAMYASGDVAGQEASPQFQRLDKNQDGRLTKDEFSAPLFDRIDADGDGVITVAEDVAFISRRKAGPRTAGPRNAGPRNAGSPTGKRAGESDKVTAKLNLPYAGTDNSRQRLDLFLPKQPATEKQLPLIVYIHGGGWQNGDKRGGLRRLSAFVESGHYAAASVGYRLSGEAIWPAQIHDCKAAIRWLRAHSETYNIDPYKIGVTGTSAGGHLVAMLGTTGDVPELEGSLGLHPAVSSRVQCVADWYGPTHLLTMGGWHNNPNSPESRLLGVPVQQDKAKSRSASPVHYVSRDDPPFLILHGTADPTVPFDQSEQLHRALIEAEVSSVLVPVVGGRHGGFPSTPVRQRMEAFFDRHLRGVDVAVSDEPIPQP